MPRIGAGGVVASAVTAVGTAAGVLSEVAVEGDKNAVVRRLGAQLLAAFGGTEGRRTEVLVRELTALIGGVRTVDVTLSASRNGHIATNCATLGRYMRGDPLW